MWSPIATGNHLDRAEKIPKVAQTTGAIDVFDPLSGISGPTSRRASACPNRHYRFRPTTSGSRSGKDLSASPRRMLCYLTLVINEWN